MPASGGFLKLDLADGDFDIPENLIDIKDTAGIKVRTPPSDQRLKPGVHHVEPTPV